MRRWRGAPCGGETVNRSPLRVGACARHPGACVRGVVAQLGCRCAPVAGARACWPEEKPLRFGFHAYFEPVGYSADRDGAAPGLDPPARPATARPGMSVANRGWFPGGYGRHVSAPPCFLKRLRNHKYFSENQLTNAQILRKRQGMQEQALRLDYHQPRGSPHKSIDGRLG